MPLGAFFNRLPKAVVIALGVLLVAVLWLLDYATGPELSLLIFYVVPIVLVVWFVGRAPALALSSVAALAWFLADFMKGRIYAHPVIPLWNMAEKLIFFVLVVQLVSTLKSALEREIYLLHIAHRHTWRSRPPARRPRRARASGRRLSPFSGPGSPPGALYLGPSPLTSCMAPAMNPQLSAAVRPPGEMQQRSVDPQEPHRQM